MKETECKKKGSENIGTPKVYGSYEGALATDSGPIVLDSLLLVQLLELRYHPNIAYYNK